MAEVETGEMQMMLLPILKTVRMDHLYFHTEYLGDRNSSACLLIAGTMAPSRFSR